MNELLMNQVEEVSGGYRVGSFGIARDALQRGIGALTRQMVNDCLANPNCYAAGNGGILTQVIQTTALSMDVSSLIA
jgi:hypothetical protein